MCPNFWTYKLISALRADINSIIIPWFGWRGREREEKRRREIGKEKDRRIGGERERERERRNRGERGEMEERDRRNGG